MRLNVYDLFTVGVVRPEGGWSKGRPIAFIEESDRCVPLTDLVLPNELDDTALAAYVGKWFRAFARPGRRIVALDAPGTRRSTIGQPNRGTAHPALKDVRH